MKILILKKMKINIAVILGFIFVLTAVNAFSQSLSGTAFELNENNKKANLEGVNIQWQGTTVGTSTDKNGNFSLPRVSGNTKLVCSFLGYRTDTMDVKEGISKLDIRMFNSSVTLSQVVVSGNSETTIISKINPRQTQLLTQGELYRAACCNLSESFETNASVDVMYSDAITGAKQIQLLGLAGIYSQIQTENVPSIRGLASAYGLNYIPGSWMESIQISKGTSSVINGYESITGQINVEFKKPAKSDKLFINLFTNSNLRQEANINGSFRINDKLSTMVMVHGDYFDKEINKIDSTQIYMNGEYSNLAENFMDLPKLNTISIFNRWDYNVPGKYISRFGIRFLREDRNGGTIDYDKNTFVLDTSQINQKKLPYGFGLKTLRTEAFWKNGFMFKDKPWKSLGIILSGVNHEQSGFFGVNNYHGNEKSLYANMIYQSIFGNTDRKFNTGISFLYDEFDEGYDQTRFRYIYQDLPADSVPSMYQITHLSGYSQHSYNWDRSEMVPGAFFEYTHTWRTLVFIAGIRGDYSSNHGFFVTPRANLRYQFNEKTVIRGSAGLGYRSANVISESIPVIASQRIIEMDDSLDQEKAMNFGINFSKEFKLFGKKADFDIDLYRTEFIKQVIVDLDKDPTTAYIYNLGEDEKSYANSFQVQLNYHPAERFSTVLAYRLNDGWSTSSGKLQRRLMQPRFKALASFSYATKHEKWKFDLTGQLNGSARISPQNLMPEIVRRDYEKSPVYSIINAQITKKFKENFDVYIGAENLLNYTQKDPITEPFIPYHTHFDTGMVWGPVIGRVIYGGLRYSIPYKD